MAIFDQDGTLADGVRVFAGIMLIVGGAFQVLQSVAALVKDEYILVLTPNYIFSFDLTVWGSIHLCRVGLGGDRRLPAARSRAGPGRRHRRRRHIGCAQLHLAALLTGVGHPGHRCRRSHHLGPGHGRSPRVGGASATTVLGSSQGLIYG